MDYRLVKYSNKITVEEYLRDYVKVEVFLECCKACPNYEQKWSCPSYDFDVEEYWKQYKYLYIMGTKIEFTEDEIKRIYTKEELEDIMNTILGKEKDVLSEQMKKMEEQYPGSISLSAGSCSICEKCSRLLGKPCISPERMRYSIESLGGDVGKTAKELMGIELKWMSGDHLPEYFTLVNGLLTNEEVKMKEEQKNPIQSAERIFSVLETLASTGPIGLVDLSNRIGLHKSTVHRFLLSLICMGYVAQEENNKYRLTYKLMEISSRAQSGLNEVNVAHPYLEKLANDCRETVHMVERRGTEVVYIDKVTPIIRDDSSIRMASQIGLSRPMYCSGVGKAILAQLAQDEVRLIWENSTIEKKTEYTIDSYEELQKELDEIRLRGYALDNQENEIGVRCIAACIFNYEGKVKNAFSISAPIIKMTDDRILELSEKVLKIKQQLSAEFGYLR